MRRVHRPLSFAIAAVLALAVLGLVAIQAQAHTRYVVNLKVVSRTDTSIYLDWTQGYLSNGVVVVDYHDNYDGYYVRVNGGPRIHYPASEGNVTGLQPGTKYRLCVSINYTAADHPDESPQTCIEPYTNGTAPPPPTTTVPIPPASHWSSSSNWNTNVAGLPVRSDNSTLVNDLAARGGGFAFNRSYGIGYAHAYASTATKCVTNTRYQFDGVTKVCGVPIPANARAADGNDGHMTVIQVDPSSPHYGCEYEWFEAVPDSSGYETSASYFDMTRTDSTGWSSLTRGSSGSNLAGAMWPEQLNGSVPFTSALGVWVDSARYLGGNALRPSKTTDGGGGSSKVPEGGAAYLDQNFDASPYPAWVQRVAPIMKTKGIRFIDQHGDAPALMAVGYVDGVATSLPFSDAYGTGAFPVAMIRALKIVAWNTADIQPQSYTIDLAATSCGTISRASNASALDAKSRAEWNHDREVRQSHLGAELRDSR